MWTMQLPARANLGPSTTKWRILNCFSGRPIYCTDMGDFRHKKAALERLDLHTVWCEGRTQTCDLTSWFKIVNNKQHHPIPTQIPTRKITGFRHRTRQSGPDWDTELCYSSSSSTGSIASSGTRTIAIEPIRIKASSPSISVNWYRLLDAG